jgi:hypothetical protein
MDGSAHNLQLHQPNCLIKPCCYYEVGRPFRKIYMREKSVTEPSNKSFTSTHALSIDILCLSTAKAKYQSRHILLSTDARKLNEAHNPEYMETSAMVPFSSPTKILINLPVFFCHMNHRPSSLPLATYSPFSPRKLACLMSVPVLQWPTYRCRMSMATSVCRQLSE